MMIERAFAIACLACAVALPAAGAEVVYYNDLFAAGEIRGFLHPVPEPETYALMLLGLAAVGAAARRRIGRTG
ncbi:MAG TPA: PEPxxWA-CTERM sorting domain-containing protein [Burkholderiaceae bacterium]|nr:PEPxxWA-CTERM sorting domain-containing protein [Burkholderiaceae bacterium]